MKLTFNWIFVLAGSIMLMTACDNMPFLPNEEAPEDNQPPATHMPPIPVEGDTVFANVTLHWDGGDEDGFPQFFQWRYSTVDPQTGDTLTKTNWMDTENRSLTITFSSPQPLNKQIFQVRAVDNQGLADPEPATRVFYTEQTVPPQVNIANPGNNSQRFFLPEPTDWYRGLQINYEGSDEDGSIQAFGWAVNDGEYNWTSDTSVVIPPSAFGNDGEHMIRLTARDDTDLTSDHPDTIRVTLVEPTFENNILVIDETEEGEFQGAATEYSDDDVDSMYSSWLDPTPHEVWDYNRRQGLPDREVLGQYKMIFWHADNWYSTPRDAHRIGFHTDLLAEYMRVGGDFIMSGWKILKSLRPETQYPAVFEDGSFEKDYLHIQEAGNSGVAIPGDFVGATGVSGSFHDVLVDTTKTEGWFPNNGNLVDINTILQPGDFTTPIYSFRCKVDCANRENVGEPVGLRYLGTSFDAVVLGFPIFFLREADADTLIHDVLVELEYR